MERELRSLIVLSSCKQEQAAQGWPHVEEAFPYVQWEPLLFYFLCLSFCFVLLGAAWLLLFDDLLIGGAGTAVRPSQTYLCSRLSQPCSLSLSSQDRCSIPSCLGGFFAELTLVFQCPPRTGRAKTGCSISLWSKGCCPMANDHFP